jgi:hypothetical protein
MTMSQQELDLCRGVVKTLRSEKNSKYNQMFMNPFPLDQVPGYLDVCPKAMDIWTLSDNLEKGLYPSYHEFFKDCFMIFDNAVKYHSDKDPTKWLVAPAKSMLKIARKQQQNVEKKMEPIVAAGGGIAVAPAAKNPKKESTGPKLKLKLSAGGGGAAASSSSATTPKIKIKQTPVSQGKTPPPGVATGDSATQQQQQHPLNKKPRLTLKIGKPKTESGSTPKSTSSTISGSTSKISLKVAGSGGGGGSRGKELPKGVAPPETKVKSETTKKTSTKKTPSTKTTSAKTAATAGIVPPGKTATTKKDKPPAKTKITLKTGGKTPKSSKDKVPFGIGSTLTMTHARKAQCAKVLNGLRRRQAKNIIWFEKPVSDKKILPDYRAKIKHPMDLSTMQTKLDNGSYVSVAAFALDLRRIFGNSIQYNTAIVKDSLRPIATEAYETAEQLLTFFVAKPEIPQPAYAPLLFCWKLCLSVIDTLYNLTNPGDGNPTAYYFMFPVSYYCGGTLPAGYLDKCPKPIDFGSITGKLLEGQYSSVDQFESDCKLVIQNCLTFYGEHPEDKVFCDQALRLDQVLQQQLVSLDRYLKSSVGQAAQKSAQLVISTSTLPKPPIPLLLSILAEMRDLQYTDKSTKITEPAMSNFEKPVSVAVFPDYVQFVQTPMDLQTVERKTKNGQYGTPEDFEYDVNLIFQNCITYNSVRKMDHLVALGRFGLKNFRRIFHAKMKVFDDPALAPALKPPPIESATRKEPPGDGAEQGPSKKIKIEMDGDSSKAAPRISLSAAALSEAQKAAQNQGRKSPKLPTSSAPKPKSNQPVPLHIAIAQVKERFPLRRNLKSLQPWEDACAKFYKELLRHPWISAARPKFIFHVPVPVLFPVSSLP